MGFPVAAYRNVGMPAPYNPRGPGYQRPPVPANDNIPVPANDNRPPRPTRFVTARGRVPMGAFVRGVARVNVVIGVMVLGYGAYRAWERIREGAAGWNPGPWTTCYDCGRAPTHYVDANYSGKCSHPVTWCIGNQALSGALAWPPPPSSIRAKITALEYTHHTGTGPRYSTVAQFVRKITSATVPAPEYVSQPAVNYPHLPRPPNPLEIVPGLPYSPPVAPPVRPTTQPGGKPRVRPSGDPDLQPRGGEETSVGPRPRPRPDPRRPPPRGDKERKVRSRVPGLIRVLREVAYAATEWGDLVDAIYDALPPEHRLKWKPDGPITPQEKLLAIYRGFEHLDLNKALLNVLRNQVEDAVIGRVTGAVQAEATSRGIILGPHGLGGF